MALIVATIEVSRFKDERGLTKLQAHIYPGGGGGDEPPRPLRLEETSIGVLMDNAADVLKEIIERVPAPWETR